MSQFAQSLRQAQILILEILNVFLWLKFSPSLTLNKIDHFSKVSIECKSQNLPEQVALSKKYFRQPFSSVSKPSFFKARMLPLAVARVYHNTNKSVQKSRWDVKADPNFSIVRRFFNNAVHWETGYFRI